MKYRVWYNRGTKDLNEAWVIVTGDHHEYHFAALTILVPTRFVCDSKRVPSGWVECEGKLVGLEDTHGALIEPNS